MEKKKLPIFSAILVDLIQYGESERLRQIRDSFGSLSVSEIEAVINLHPVT